MNHPGRIPEWQGEIKRQIQSLRELFTFIIKSEIKCHYFGYSINLLV